MIGTNPAGHIVPSDPAHSERQFANRRFVFDTCFSLGFVEVMSRLSAVSLAVLVLTIAVASAHDEEPTQEICDAAVAEARAQAATLPADDVSRYFAERDIQQALAEAGNGEFDDCVEKAERAVLEVRDRPHSLKPGERLNILSADEMPTR